LELFTQETTEDGEAPMTEPRTASQLIADEVGSWPGVEVDREELGEVAFAVGGRQIGHVHGDHAVHLNLDRRSWYELRDAGRIEPHPVFPKSHGPAQRRIESEDDVQDAIELLRISYERVVARKSVPVTGS
jgi:hypothetical protein